MEIPAKPDRYSKAGGRRGRDLAQHLVVEGRVPSLHLAKDSGQPLREPEQIP